MAELVVEKQTKNASVSAGRIDHPRVGNKPELAWYEIYPPAGIRLGDVTALLRPLAGRGRTGIWRSTPVVVFELWLRHQEVRLLIGLDQRLIPVLPEQLAAQMPGLTLNPIAYRAVRGDLTLGLTVRSPEQIHSLRLDTAENVTAALIRLAGSLGKREKVVLQWLVGAMVPRHKLPTQFHLREALGLKKPEAPTNSKQRAWQAKAAEPVFLAQGRLGVRTQHLPRARTLLAAAFNALELANGSHARLIRSPISSRTARKLSSVTGRGRPSSSLLGATELAALVGWPIGGSQLPGQLGPALAPAPAALLAGENPPACSTRQLGHSLHPGDGGQAVFMPLESSLHHLHVVGPTGSGKSTLLTNLALNDAAVGHGLLVLEPKGDLIRDLLARLPEERHDDVILIEPTATGRVVGFNPLAGSRDEAERRADELLGQFKAIFGSAIGPRSSDVLLHALITAARLPDGTLADLPWLLTNPAFRRRSLDAVNDELVLGPFWASFEALSPPEKAQAVAPVLNKLRAFLSRSAVRRIIGQSQPAFQLDELFTRQRIILINLNRGHLGPETARLLGSLLLAALWQAIQRRASWSRAQRRPVMVVVDEWQDFVAGMDFAAVLAQARGLGVGFTLAHQHLGQLTADLRAAVMANARNRVVFRPAEADQRHLASVLGMEASDLRRLSAFQAACQLLLAGAPTRTFGVRSLAMPQRVQSAAVMRSIALDRYGVNPKAVDAALLKRWRGGETRTKLPAGVLLRSAS